MSAHHGGVLPAHPERATLEGRNKLLGFWLFLGGESVLFGCLFATFLGLRGHSDDLLVNHPREFFDLGIVAISTLILLVSSLTSVLAILAMHKRNMAGIYTWFTVTVLLGLGFLGLEIYEFYHYSVEMQFKFTESAYASSFYTLVGFHGAHVLFGTLWISLLLLQLTKKGLTVVTAPKLYVAALYWHFVDLVWVFIFTVVYLMGKVA
jgi:cytochrome c oxidase subunit 3